MKHANDIKRNRNMQKSMKFQLIGSIISTNREIDFFCRKRSLEGRITHQKKAVQDQIKAKIFLVSLRSAPWLEIGDN